MNVAILLSTYNGARYLPAQLASLAVQSHKAWRLYVRDDGSSDGTLELIRRFADAHPGRVEAEAGSNLGAVASFLALLGRTDIDADAFAFCDQDDVWYPDKIERAVAWLQTAGDQAALLCTRVRLVDAELRPKGFSPLIRSWGFEHALFENIAMGCTTVLNRRAQMLLAGRLPPAKDITVHDWWCYLAIAAVGRVHFDPQPSLDYRLHQGNVIGLTTGRAAEILRQLRLFARNPRTFFQTHRQIASLLARFGDLLSEPQRRLATELVEFKGHPLPRLLLAVRAPVRRQRRFDAVVTRALVALGMY